MSLQRVALRHFLSYFRGKGAQLQERFLGERSLAPHQSTCMKLSEGREVASIANVNPTRGYCEKPTGGITSAAAHCLQFCFRV